MARSRQSFYCRTKNDAGFTLVELLEVVLAAALAVWLAFKLASRFHGAWRIVVFFGVTLIGTALLGTCLIVGFAYVFDVIERHVGQNVEPGESIENAEDRPPS